MFTDAIGEVMLNEGDCQANEVKAVNSRTSGGFVRD